MGKGPKRIPEMTPLAKVTKERRPENGDLIKKTLKGNLGGKPGKRDLKGNLVKEN